MRYWSAASNWPGSFASSAPMRTRRYPMSRSSPMRRPKTGAARARLGWDAIDAQRRHVLAVTHRDGFGAGDRAGERVAQRPAPCPARIRPRPKEIAHRLFHRHVIDAHDGDAGAHACNVRIAEDAHRVEIGHVVSPDGVEVRFPRKTARIAGRAFGECHVVVVQLGDEALQCGHEIGARDGVDRSRAPLLARMAPLRALGIEVGVALVDCLAELVEILALLSRGRRGRGEGSAREEGEGGQARKGRRACARQL